MKRAVFLSSRLPVTASLPDVSEPCVWSLSLSVFLSILYSKGVRV